MLNIDGSVQVAVMLNPAHTAPEAVAETEIGMHVAAHATALAGRKEAVNDDQSLPIPVSFVAQQQAKATMGSIGKRTTQLGSRKSPYVQVFDGYSLEAVDQAPALLMQKCGTLVGNLAVHPRQACARTPSIAAGLVFARQVPVGTAQDAFLASGQPRIGNPLTGTEDRKVFESRVHPYGGFRHRRRDRPVRQLNVRDQGDEPVPGGIAFEGGRCCLALNRPVLAQAYTANLRDGHMTVLHGNPVGDAKTGLIALFGLEAREAGTVLKEVRERLLQVAQGLLERLTIHVAQPARFRLSFKRRQLGCEVLVAQALPVGFVVRTRAVERPIPNIPPRTGKLQQVLLLLTRWFHPELVGFLDRTHTYSVPRECVTYRHTCQPNTYGRMSVTASTGGI